MEGISKLTKSYDLSMLLKSNSEKDTDKDLKDVAEEFESLY